MPQQGRCGGQLRDRGIHTQVFASKYLTKLPDEAALAAELTRTRKLLEGRTLTKGKEAQGW